MAATATQGGHN